MSVDPDPARAADPAGGIDARSDVLAVALEAQRAHVFATATECVCGYAPTTALDWEQHRMQAAIVAVAAWIASHASVTMAGDPFIRAADWAAGLLLRDPM